MAKPFSMECWRYRQCLWDVVPRYCTLSLLNFTNLPRHPRAHKKKRQTSKATTTKQNPPKHMTEEAENLTKALCYQHGWSPMVAAWVCTHMCWSASALEISVCLELMPITPPLCSQQPPKIATLTSGAVAFSHEDSGCCHVYLPCVSVVVILYCSCSSICLNVTVIVLITAVLVFKIWEKRGVFCMIWLFLNLIIIICVWRCCENGHSCAK